jgi:hypothetical protein
MMLLHVIEAYIYNPYPPLANPKPLYLVTKINTNTQK